MIQQIIVQGVIFKVGTILRHCTAQACVSHKVTRVRVTQRGNVHDLVEVAGILAVDPMMAYYDELLRRGVLPKNARAKACKKFKLGRSQFFARMAAR